MAAQPWAVITPRLYGMASHTGAPWTHCIQLCLQGGSAFCRFVGDRPGVALQPPGNLLACAGPHWQPRGLLLAAFVVHGSGPCCTRLCTVQDCQELAGSRAAASAHWGTKMQPGSRELPREAMQRYSEAWGPTTIVPSICLCRCGPPAGCAQACAGHGRVGWAIG